MKMHSCNMDSTVMAAQACCQLSQQGQSQQLASAWYRLCHAQLRQRSHSCFCLAYTLCYAVVQYTLIQQHASAHCVMQARAGSRVDGATITMIAGVGGARLTSASVEREQAEPEQPGKAVPQKTGIKVKFKRLKKE